MEYTSVKNGPRGLLVPLIALFLSTFTIFGVSGERVVVDMFGRKVVLPDRVERVVSGTPVITIMVYMLAPDDLVGWNFKPNGKLMREKYLNLPVIGGWFGKKTGNYETFLALKPDVYIEGYSNLGEVNKEMLEERQRKMGSIPVVGVRSAADVSSYGEVIDFLGKVLGKEGEAEKLSQFYHDVLELVRGRLKGISSERRVSVYYAEGADGLSTDPAGAVHSELIELCGGKNVASIGAKEGFGRVKVSVEQVLSWNPEIIITTESEFFKEVFTDQRWAGIEAVKKGRVYLAPREPFGWFDRPAGINRIPGILWTAYRLYPGYFDRTTIEKMVHEFYLEFYHYSLGESQLESFFN